MTFCHNFHLVEAQSHQPPPAARGAFSDESVVTTHGGTQSAHHHHHHQWTHHGRSVGVQTGPGRLPQSEGVQPTVSPEVWRWGQEVFIFLALAHRCLPRAPPVAPDLPLHCSGVTQQSVGRQVRAHSQTSLQQPLQYCQSVHLKVNIFYCSEQYCTMFVFLHCQLHPNMPPVTASFIRSFLGS